MRLSSNFSSLIILVTLCSFSLSQHVITDVFYWPVTSSEPTTLARVSYDSVSLEHNLLSYSPPDTIEKDPQNRIVRVGVFTSTATNPKQWVGTLTSLSALRENHVSTLQLYLDPSNEIYHVSFMSSTEFTGVASDDTRPRIELVLNNIGPRPYLNRPIAVGPDGTNPDEPIEKTFLQKYWWIFLIVTFLAMSGGGEAR